MKKRLLYFWLAIAFSRLVPVGLVLFKFDFFKDTTSPLKRISIIGILIIIFMAVSMFKDLVSFINSLENKQYSMYIKYAKVPAVFFVGWMLTKWVYLGVDSLSFVLSWSFISNVVAMQFWVMHEKEIVVKKED